MPNEKPIPQQIPIEKIHDLPGIPLVKLPDKSYGGLVSSILLDGVKEPVILRQREDGEYQLVSGYRRRKASELAKLKNLPTLVYDMTEKEAQEYRKAATLDPKTPIPGKLMEKDSKAPAEEKAAEVKPSVTEKKAEEKKAAAPVEKAAAEVKPEKATDAKAAPAEKKADPAPTEAKKPQEEKKPDPTQKPIVDDKKPADDKTPVAASAEKKAEATPPKAEKSVEAPKPAAPESKPAEQKETKTAEATPAAPAETEKEKKAAPAKAPAKKKEEEKPVGTAAVGPTGTAITKILGEKLDPPTAKDKKALPIPGEGEAFSVVLHPAYLKKADINKFSVDRDSDDFKELYASIKRFGVKDPVLARFGKDGELEIISGQRRHLIASELNYPVPTTIQQIDDDDAGILVADGNLHRDHISTYDLSRAVKLKSESMKRKAGRRSKSETGPRKIYTDEAIAAEMGMSTAKLNRLMKLADATRQVCDLVDDGTIQLSIAYNIAFLSPKHQDMVADLVGINVKVNTENTGRLKQYVDKNADVNRVRAILEGKYPPPKVVETPKPAPAPTTTPALVSTNIPKSPDIPAPPQPDKIVQFPPVASASDAPAVPSSTTAPTPQTQTAQPAAPAAATSTEPAKPADEPQDRENSYETKIVLRGDRLRKYFPDVSMTPREIEDSIYDALEMRRQVQERQKQKSEIFGKDKKGPVK